jgi:hypothetical protein
MTAMGFSAASAVAAAVPGNSLVVTKPAGTVQFDLMFASITCASDMVAITPPAGWTLIIRDNCAVAPTYCLATYYKVAGASEGANYTWNFDVSLEARGAIVTYFSIDDVTIVDAQGSQVNSASVTRTAPSITTTVPAGGLIMTYAYIGTVGSTTPGSGLTERIDTNVNGLNLVIDDALNLTGPPGSTGAKTVTGSVSVTSIGINIAFNLLRFKAFATFAPTGAVSKTTTKLLGGNFRATGRVLKNGTRNLGGTFAAVGTLLSSRRVTGAKGNLTVMPVYTGNLTVLPRKDGIIEPQSGMSYVP